MTPIGSLALIFADPLVLRWVISGLVLVLLAVLASGWRYHGKPTLPVMAAVGAVSGLGSGAVQIAGPPVIIFWLGGRADAITVRANLMVFFVLLSLASGVTYLAQGLIVATSWCCRFASARRISRAVGRRTLLPLASETTYRRIAYGIVAASALVSVPLFDGLFRNKIPRSPGFSSLHGVVFRFFFRSGCPLGRSEATRFPSARSPRRRPAPSACRTRLRATDISCRSRAPGTGDRARRASGPARMRSATCSGALDDLVAEIDHAEHDLL